MNTRDFFHGKSQFFIRFIKTIFITLLFIIPLCILIVSLFYVSGLLLAIAMLSMYLGLMAERWYFFAEGNHPQNIYYQSIA